MYLQYNRKATSYNPLMDNTATSGLKVLKCLFWCMICPLMQLFYSQTPVDGHLPLADTYPWSQGCPLTGGSTVFYFQAQFFRKQISE